MTEPIQVPSAGKPESICPSCGKVDKTLFAEGCNNAWHRERGEEMSEIRRYDMEAGWGNRPHDYKMQERPDGEYVAYLDHAVALRQQVERIAALERAIKNLLNWYSHEMPQLESGTQKAMDDAEKLLEAK